ncbi:MAG TPA: PhzF family phenazine biosynthesis protein [Thermoflexia bacterium]|jgi:PhzF family phenazine biosynthesis protein|nr:PhzF family phenazine biosynthesis protein [Thermoflexia bacterium]
MGVQLFQVDAFTDQPFRGNPAAVCLLPGPRDEAWMQNVAREMNLSETAFVYRENDGFRLRWFTPAVEVDLCGHATLATAHVLWEVGWLAPEEPARFHTRSGLLTARRGGSVIELDFPALPEEPVECPPGLEEALGVAPSYVGKSKFDYLVEVASEEAVRAMKPDFGRLKTLSSARGFIVTSRTTSGEYDFVSRYFAPGAGVDEDPVTGSAHCCLGPFWGKRLGKQEMVGYQASARGGVVRVRLAGNRVYIGGQAVTVMRGELVVP